MLTTQTDESLQTRPSLLMRPFLWVWHWIVPPSQAQRDRQSVVGRVLAILAVLTVIVGLSVGAVLISKPGREMWKNYKAGRYLKQSKEMEDKGDPIEAFRLATKAYHTAPDNPEAVRTLAKFYVLAKQKEAGYLLDKLHKLGGFTDDDLVMEITALSNANDNKTAGDKIEERLRHSKPTRKVVEIADKVMQQIGRFPQLLEILKSYVEQSPDDLDVRLVYAFRRMEYGNPLEASEGMAAVWDVAATDGEAGLRALEFLDGQKLPLMEEQRRLVNLMQSHPLAKEEHRIAALKRLVALEPQRRGEILDKAITDRQSLSRAELAPLAGWLSTEGEYDRFFSVFNEEKVKDTPELLGHYLNALMLMKRHEEMEKLIKDPETRLMAHERDFYTAHLAFVTGQKWEEVNSLLFKALSTAEQYGRADQVLRIAQYAEQRNHPVVAEQAYKSASSSTRVERIQKVAFEGLVKLTYRNGNSKGYMDACLDSSTRWPNNAEFRERALYASLLSGLELETSIPLAQKLLDERPDDSARKLLVALGHYRMLDYQAAFNQVRKMDLNQLSWGQGAVLSGILQAGGSLENANNVAKTIPEGQAMLQEEMQFLLRVNPARLMPMLPGQGQAVVAP